MTVDVDIVEGDAFERYPVLGSVPNVFTSLPDMAEMPDPTDSHAWTHVFVNAVAMIASSLEPDGYAIFYQTDRRIDGHIVSKASTVVEVAARFGCRTVWHKIAVHGFGTSLYRPNYSHLVCVSKRGRAGRPTPDVFASGSKRYSDATDSAALKVGLDFLVARGATFLVDPFAGRASIACAAAVRGVGSVSIEIEPAQVELARANVAALDPAAHVRIGEGL